MDYQNFEDNNPFIGSAHSIAHGIDTFKEVQPPQEPSPPLSPSPSPPPPLPPQQQHVSITSYTIQKDYKNYQTVYYSIGNTLRRYSDFRSFRAYLTRFYPYLFIPPLPEKHSFSRVLRNPLAYTSDPAIIARRIRLLNYFLNRLFQNKTLANSTLTARFLDQKLIDWHSALNEPPFTDLAAHSPLLRLTKDPTKLSPYFTAFPLTAAPTSTLTPLAQSTFRPLLRTATTLLKLATALEHHSKHLSHSLTTLHEHMALLGATLNIFSLQEGEPQIEHFGTRIDLTFLNIERLVAATAPGSTELLTTIKSSARVCISLLQFQSLKETQLAQLKHNLLQAQTTLHRDLASTKSVLQTHRDQLARIVNVLKPGYLELREDLAFLSVNVEREVGNELRRLILLIVELVKDWVQSGYVEYTRSCVEVWKKNGKNLQTIT